MTAQTLTLPWPPTINTYWRHVGSRVLISRKGRIYRTDLMRMALAEGWKRFGDQRLRVHITAFPPDKRRRDLDNLPKCVLDALEHARVFDNDGQIDDLRIKRGPVKPPGRLQISIEAF